MDQFVSAGEMVRLTCNVSGSEPISYQWLKDGQSLTGRIDRVLMLFPVSSSTFGEYQCNASNDVNQVLSEVAVVHGEGSINQSINQSIQQMFLQYWRSSLHMVYKLNGI